MGALVKVLSSAVAAASEQAPAALIRNGITDLTIAFQAGAQRSDGDRARSMQLYAEAVSSFHPAIAAHTLRWLRLHNPRNPFPPTPQDVYEACTATNNDWHGAMLDHFGLSAGRRTTLSRYGSPSPAPRGAPFEGSPPPFTSGCVAPPDLVVEFLRKALAGSGFDNELCQMSEARLAALPDGVLTPDHLERVLAARAKEKAEREEREYLDSLPDDLRRARHDAWLECVRQGVKATEEELVARAQAALGRRREKHGIEACDAECAGNSGCAKCAPRSPRNDRAETAGRSLQP